MNAVGDYRIGRICLHVAAMALDHQFKWHLAGIERELSLSSAIRTVFVSMFVSKTIG
jgi:hypothetical protein